MDKIGDLLNRIATANPNTKEIKVQNSKYKREILKVLYEEGWIAGITEKKVDFAENYKLNDPSFLKLEADNQAFFESTKNRIQENGAWKVKPEKVVKELIIFLKRPYIDASNTRWINLNPKINRISKPGRRIYFTAKQNQKLLLKLTKISNTVVLSTSKGVMTIKKAVELNLGGELLFKISA